ncbi:aldo-keto reductase family 1 member C3-like isoform X3 [Marmota monax]|uniref:aldo-keto reductase family 1 member C3-like isoform X3 n=1 Tax=Marmota monax TaxID=9995 RepID=UPI001EB0A74F|nr:aldo-keto reductase family 1 member C3-like isoform X3 [Marmota monax]
MNSKHQYVELNDGHFIPGLGFGTYKPQEVSKSKTTEATKIAIEAGFCHIDCAYAYQVEEEVGLAIRSKIADGTVKREDILYTSKLWSTFHRPELVQSFLKRSLKKLHFDYVDLYLIHIPTAMKPGEELYPKDENGKILYDSVDLCATWEVECHVYHNQKKLLDFCKSKDIVLVAFRALGTQREKRWVDQSSPVLLDDPVLGALAKKHKRSPALTALRYQLQCGVVVPAKSFNENRIKENIQVFDFTLTAEDMKDLDGLNRNFQYIAWPLMTNHPEYPFDDEY